LYQTREKHRIQSRKTNDRASLLTLGENGQIFLTLPMVSIQRFLKPCFSPKSSTKVERQKNAAVVDAVMHMQNWPAAAAALLLLLSLSLSLSLSLLMQRSSQSNYKHFFLATSTQPTNRSPQNRIDKFIISKPPTNSNPVIIFAIMTNINQ
jgi:hypothetical protein